MATPIFIISVIAAGFLLKHSVARKDESLFIVAIAALLSALISLVFVVGLLNALIMILGTTVVFGIVYEKKSGAIWCKPLVAACGLLGLIIGAVNIYLNSNPTHADTVIPESTRRNEIVAGGYGLGVYVRNLSHDKILILTGANADEQQLGYFMEGLRIGIVMPSVEIAREVTATGDSDAISDDIPIDQYLADKTIPLINKHAASTLVISMVPIPVKVIKHFADKRDSAYDKMIPEFIFFDLIPNRGANLIEEKFVRAVITGNPTPGVYEAASASETPDYAGLFEEKYILIDRNNLPTVKSAYPLIFN